MPGRPVSRASASAMKPAELSCRQVTVSIGLSCKASSTGRKLSPGRQNTRSTPLASSSDTNNCPAVFKIGVFKIGSSFRCAGSWLRRLQHPDRLAVKEGEDVLDAHRVEALEGLPRAIA